jgi:hypothetical protein
MVPREKTMNMVWDRHITHGINELGYDVGTQTMAVVFADKTKKFHAPVPYPLYASIFHARFPLRLYKEVVAGKIPAVSGS